MAQAFERTGQAMVTVVTDVPVRTLEVAHIHCHAPDRELLLVDWLNGVDLRNVGAPYGVWPL